jgi:hypothetical protein
MAGCVRTGDFGRIEGSASESGQPRPLIDPIHTGSVPTGLALTDDEQQLRALARNLIASPRDHAKWLGFGAAAAPADPTPAGVPREAALYAAQLLRGPYASAAARYARLTDDTRNDLVRVDPFFALARRVVDIDHKRERTLAYIPALTPASVGAARQRMQENRRLIADVRRALAARTVMYRYALERLVVAVPSTMAVEAERARMELERHVAALAVFAGADLAVLAPAPPRHIIAKP